MPVGVAGGVFLVLAGWTLTIDQVFFNDGTPLEGLGTALFSGMLACAAASVSVHYFNRPKWLVPPRLRHDPGLLAERRLPDFDDFDDIA
jgi:hypothetical protein